MLFGSEIRKLKDDILKSGNFILEFPYPNSFNSD